MDSLSATSEVDEKAWAAFVAAKRDEELDRRRAGEPRTAATRAYVAAAFRDGAVQPAGTTITRILRPSLALEKPVGAPRRSGPCWPSSASTSNASSAS